MQEYKVCVITVAYNRANLMKEMIRALQAQTSKIDRFIIVDNSTNSEIMELVKKFNDPTFELNYNKMEKNVGSSKGFNIAVNIAMKYDFDFLWILDDDTIPDNDCLEKMLSKAYILDNINEKFSFLCSLTYGHNNVPITIPEPSQDVDQFSGYKDCFKFLEIGLVKVKCATFCSLLIKREAVSKVGCPVKCFTMWAEDSEYTMRLSRYYGSGYVVGESKAFHKRKIAKTLNIENENSKERLNNYKYLYRNNLIISNSYNDKKRTIMEICKYLILTFKILFSSQNYKFQKIKAVYQGLFMYLFRIYDVKSYKSRMVITE